MMRYLALLRGINVSGKKSVPMAALKAAFEKRGFEEVRTFIQSGNVIFATENEIPDKDISLLTEKLIKEDFGFDVPVIIRKREEISRIIAQIPFPGLDRTAYERYHVTLLEETPDPALVNKIDPEPYLPDRFKVIGKEVFLYCPAGYGQTKLTNNFFESRLKQKATTRNMRTMAALAELINS